MLVTVEGVTAKPISQDVTGLGAGKSVSDLTLGQDAIGVKLTATAALPGEMSFRHDRAHSLCSLVSAWR